MGIPGRLIAPKHFRNLNVKSAIALARVLFVYVRTEVRNRDCEYLTSVLDGIVRLCLSRPRRHMLKGLLRVTRLRDFDDHNDMRFLVGIEFQPRSRPERAEIGGSAASRCACECGFVLLAYVGNAIKHGANNAYPVIRVHKIHRRRNQ